MQNRGVKVSIITVNKNNSAGLVKTIQSVVSQEFSDFEYIVIDGGSSDNSCNVINNYRQNINYWISEADNGVYHAMNKGITMASGEYCIFLNSGDYLFNNTVLERFAKFDNKADIISGDALVVLGKNRFELVKAPKAPTFYTFYKHSLLHQATFIKREMFEKLGFYNQNLKILADWEFFIRALISENTSYKSIPLTISVFDTDGMSSQPRNSTICQEERSMVLNKYFPLFLPDYKLIESRPIFDFLSKLQHHRRVKKWTVLLFRIMNKVL